MKSLRNSRVVGESLRGFAQLVEIPFPAVADLLGDEIAQARVAGAAASGGE